MVEWARRYFVGLALADLDKQLPGHQRVRDFSKGVQDGFAILEFEFVPRRVALAVLAHQAASLKKWTGSFGRNSPGVSCPQGKARQFWTDLPQNVRESNLREEIGHRFTYLGVV